MDIIQLKNIIVSSYLNLNPTKPVESIPIKINLSLFTEFNEAASADNLDHSIDYAKVASEIRSIAEDRQRWSSFEQLAQEICRICLTKFGAQKANVRIEQTKAFFNVAAAGIEITRNSSDLPENHDSRLVTLADDKLFINKLTISTIIGVEGFERDAIQQLETSFEIYPTLETEFQSSAQLHTIIHEFSEYIKSSNYKTVEAFINSLAVLGLEKFKFRRIKIRVDKPSAIPWADAASVEVDHDQAWLQNAHDASFNAISDTEIGSGEHFVLIGIGSNMGCRMKNFDEALTKLNNNGNCKILDTSFLYETTAKYYTDQPNFLNAVFKIRTTLPPRDLLNTLKCIEAELGRTESFRNSPRLIDLDILFYDNFILETQDLIIPHPGVLEREFVLRPLCDIAKHWRHPKLGKTCDEMLTDLLKTSKPDDGGFVFGKALPMYRSCEAHWSWNDKTMVMGILNMSTDSFSDAGYPDVNEAVVAAEQMARDGADVIDVGGMTRKPGADEEAMSPAEEIARIVPLIRALRAKGFALPISVDTVRAEVARAVVEAGAGIINDVSGGMRDPAMLSTVASLGVPYIIMHMRGTSATMTNEENTNYGNAGVIADIREKLGNAVEAGIAAGIYRWNFILDAGLGFSKLLPDSFATIRDHKLITKDDGPLRGFPTLLGPSRKRFIGTVTGVSEPAKRGYGTAAAVAACVAGGANIVRVHDVKEMVEVTRVADHVWKRGNSM